MRRCWHFLSAVAVALSFLATGNLKAAEQGATFTVQPDRCIALNRGQMCYQELTFRWQTLAGQRYCLYQQEVEEALVCWAGAEKNSHQVEFASDRNITYTIRREGQMEILAEVEVELAWVYQSNRKSFSRWRLF